VKIVSFEEIEAILMEKLEMQAQVSLRVKGGSMFPFFKDNETIVTLEKANLPLKKRDVILYSTDHGKVLHRIIRIKDDKLTTCGDALTKLETVSVSDIIAKVVRFEHNHKTTLAENAPYRFKVWIWNCFRPLRKILLKVFRRCL